MTLTRRLGAEFIGTAFLLCIVVGSGIMGERLAEGNAAVALLANSIATGAGLYVLIRLFSPVSGAHFNPSVSLVSLFRGQLSVAQTTAYISAQITGALAGVVTAHVMFGLPLLQISSHTRSSAGEFLGEAVASFGLLLVISLTPKVQSDSLPLLVAAFVTSAYWFTSSTAFANPAVTLARTMTNTFSGIAPESFLAFVAAQLLGAMAAMAASTWFRARR